MEQLRNTILEWYRLMQRDLPWRRTDNPYQIWLSEVILQQTRVVQGKAYYERFIERFPDIESLAAAEERDVLKEWEGLGYYSRARNLHVAARQVIERHRGIMPANYSELIKLRGVGPYTAAAVASIAFSEPVPVVDGNVARLMARLFAIGESIETSGFKAKVNSLLLQMIDQQDPGTFNQAMMEVGALLCLPAKPLCSECPLTASCEAYNLGIVDKLPIRKKGTALKTRHFNYIVWEIYEGDNSFTLLHRRSQKDIWQHLYEFPLIETAQVVDEDHIMGHELIRALSGKHEICLQPPPVELQHILSHQRIMARFFRIKTTQHPSSGTGDFILVSTDKLSEFPLSKLMLKYIAIQFKH